MINPTLAAMHTGSVQHFSAARSKSILYENLMLLAFQRTRTAYENVKNPPAILQLKWAQYVQYLSRLMATVL
jgi:hypothetical protein